MASSTDDERRRGPEASSAVFLAAGIVASRSEAVRLGLQHLVNRHRRNAAGARIVAGYLASPQSDDEGGWSDESTVA